jgi:hypothetical protein
MGRNHPQAKLDIIPQKTPHIRELNSFICTLSIAPLKNKK